MNFIIGIGGTGARCIEAVIHLCAMGLGPKDLFIIFIDPDRTNGNLSKANKVWSHYIKCKEITGNSRLFTASIKPSVKDNTFSFDIKGKSLETLFGMPMYSSDELKSIVNLLFSKPEIIEPLDNGFKGRPSIGAAVMSTIQVEVEDACKMKKGFWYDVISAMENEMAEGGQAKVFVYSSIFGGTGAAGFPAIGKILKNHRWIQPDRLVLGGCLLLPYFSYTPEKVTGKIYADPQKFYLRTKTSLEYYDNYIWRANNKSYDALWFLGNDSINAKRPFKEGGAYQNNPADILEVLAALSSFEFFANDHLEAFGIARKSPDTVYFSDIPRDGDLKEKLISFKIFSEAILNFYVPLFTDPAFLDKDKIYKLAPWLTDGRMEKLIDDKQNMNDLTEYLKNHFLPWMSNSFSDGSCKCKLFTTHEGIIVDDLSRLLYYDKDDGECNLIAREKEPYNFLWDAMCKLHANGKTKWTFDNIHSPTGKFAASLYECATEFTKKCYLSGHDDKKNA